MKPLLSVIIPVYRVEHYLHECVDSVLSQTYTNLEVVLVDDGSPDNCPALCDEYAGQDNRIRVIHQSNQGLSAARNAGLDIATGQRRPGVTRLFRSSSLAIRQLSRPGPSRTTIDGTFQHSICRASRTCHN